MIDPAGIRRRGAERSAPRSRSGPSAAESQRVARSAPSLVPARAPRHAPIVLREDPPHARLEIERGVVVTQRDALHLLPARSGGAVERAVPATQRIGGVARRIRRVRAKLGPERRDTSAGAVACLTSARRGGDAGHEPVVVVSVLGRAPVGAGEAAGIAVERGALALKHNVE